MSASDIVQHTKGISNSPNVASSLLNDILSNDKGESGKAKKKVTMTNQQSQPETPKAAAPKAAAAAASTTALDLRDKARQLLEYKKSKVFASVFEDFELPKNFSLDSPAGVIEQAWREASSLLHGDCKRKFVDSIFDQIFSFGETAMVQYFNMGEMEGLADVAMVNKESFQPELEELAIQLSSDYVPSPMFRLGMKMFQFSNGYRNRPRKKIVTSEATTTNSKNEMS